MTDNRRIISIPVKIRIESEMVGVISFRDDERVYTEKRRWYVVTRNADVGFGTWREAMDYADSFIQKKRVA